MRPDVEPTLARGSRPRLKTPPHEIMTGASGEMVAWSPCDAICVTRMHGHMDSPLAGALLRYLDAWVGRRGRDLSIFHDWAGMENYDLSARIALTRWTFERRPLFREVHLLVRSKIVELGVEATNMALGRFMTTYREAPMFERALQLALGRERAELAR